MRGFGPERFPFQLGGASFLAYRDNALLADEQGLGKTIQAIDAADAAMARRILVVCKRVGRLHWAREFAAFSPVQRRVQLPGTKDRIDPGVELTIIHFDIIHRKEILAQLVKQTWDLIIVDEMHNLKGGENSLRGQVLLGNAAGGHSAKWLCNRTGGMWGLSGTPMPNHAGDLYPWLRALHRDLLPPVAHDYDGFMRTFTRCVASPYGGYRVFGNKATNLMASILRGMMLRRTRREVLPQLPDLIIDYVPLPGRVDTAVQLWENTPEAHQIRDVLLAMDPEGNPAEAALAWGNDLSTLRRLTGMAKAADAAEIVADELTSGAHEKVVVFGWHPDVLEAMAAILAKQGFNPITLHGRSSDDVKDNAESWFQDDPSRRVLLGNIQTAGTTITLTRAHRLFFVEPSWVPGENEQAMLRILRIGQTENCHVTFLGLANTLDDLITATYTRKAKMLSELYQATSVGSADRQTPHQPFEVVTQ
jgi:SNF2 family DNA or RNA helicase